MLRVTSSIQTKRSAKNVSCVFVAQKELLILISKKKNVGTHVLQVVFIIYTALRQFELHMYT